MLYWPAAVQTFHGLKEFGTMKLRHVKQLEFYQIRLGQCASPYSPVAGIFVSQTGRGDATQW